MAVCACLVVVPDTFVYDQVIAFNMRVLSGLVSSYFFSTFPFLGSVIPVRQLSRLDSDMEVWRNVEEVFGFSLVVHASALLGFSRHCLNHK